MAKSGISIRNGNSVKSINVLLVEDNPADAVLVGEYLKEGGRSKFNLLQSSCLADAVSRLSESSFDVILLDMNLPDSTGIETFEKMFETVPDIPIVCVTGNDNEELGVSTVQQGAQDFLVKGRFDSKILIHAINFAIERKQAEKKYFNSAMKKFFPPQCPAGVGFVGNSTATQETLRTIRSIGRSRCNPVLILGETGTGKELAARAVHAWRCHTNQPFTAVNCAALTANLLESELFGHTKGSFTSADREKVGLLELAGEGSVFLDEISEIPMDLQAKLLRVLQEQNFRKVGGTQLIPVKATIIASSNRDLLKEVDKGTFRRDLFYRLNVFPINLRPLRAEKRREDIPILAEFFAETSNVCAGGAKRINPDAIDLMMKYDWPGNVRELRNVIERAKIVEQSPEITPDSIAITVKDLSDPKENSTPTHAKETHDNQIEPLELKSFSLKDAERELIIRVLLEAGWSKTKAAKMLGITRPTLHSKLHKFDINPPETLQTASQSA